MSQEVEIKEIAKVIPLQKPFPLPAEIPFATPSPEDALIEMMDLDRNK